MGGMRVRDPGAYERRGRHRVGMEVPVEFSRAPGDKGKAGDFEKGQTSNVSTGGVYLTTGGAGSFEPGELLGISISIPVNFRRGFPFSRIMGTCRVVRSEQLPETPEGTRWGLALEFCGGRITMLGAI